MEPIVRTTAGTLRGREKEGIFLFAGIPFAAPPVGELRFRPPQPHPGWSGTRDALRFGRVAAQKGDTMEGVFTAPPPDWDEDCLFLNVQTPALDDARRPVMVWIHGGGFINGTGAIPWYDGSNLIRHGDVVVVSINYRLGALGWLYLGGFDPAFRSSGNNGLLDQIAALEWVRDNIAGFGGDPDNVTVFGESAGGMSTATLLGTPRAMDLIHKAIPQSGACHNVWPIEDASEVTSLIMEGLGTDDLAGVLAAPAERLIEVQTKVGAQVEAGRARSSNGHWGTTFAPIVDGHVLPRAPLDAVRDGLSHKVKLLIGTTRDEWNLFALSLGPVHDDETIRRRLARSRPDPDAVIAAYRNGRDGATPGEIWSAIMTDRVFRVPAIRLAEAQSKHQPANTFMYRFDFASPAMDGVLGACHSLEIPFNFDNLHKPGIDFFAGPNPPQSLATTMRDAWLAFARTGNPSTESLAWPAYEPAKEPGRGRATMLLDAASHLENDPRPADRKAWDNIL